MQSDSTTAVDGNGGSMTPAHEAFIRECGVKPGRTTGPKFSAGWDMPTATRDDERREKWEEDRSLWAKAWDAAVAELAGIEGDGANDDPGALCIECKEPFYHQFNCSRIGNTSTVSAADTTP